MDTNPDLPAKHNSPKYTQQMKFTVSWLAVLIIAYNTVVVQPPQTWTALRCICGWVGRHSS